MTTEYTPTMDELIDGYRAMRVQELAPVGPAFKRLLVSVEAVVEAHRAIAAHDAVRDQRIAELTASLRAAKAYARKGWEHHDKQWRRAEAAEAKIAAVERLCDETDVETHEATQAWLVGNIHAALTATGQDKGNE